MIKVGEVAAGALEEEAEDLLEEQGHRQSLAALAKASEEQAELGQKPEGAQVAREEGHARAAGERVAAGGRAVKRRGGGLAIDAGNWHCGFTLWVSLWVERLGTSKVPKHSHLPQRVFSSLKP